MSDTTSIEASKIPRGALWLGWAGVVPFAAGVAGLYATTPLAPDVARAALLGYGAVILSFLGGVVWGVALLRDGDRPDARLLALAVVPSLLGWGTLLLPPGGGFALLIFGFVAQLLVDHGLGRAEVHPPWYPRLRLRLSVVVIGLLLIAAGAG